ncbi:Tim21p KNAG_0D03930 [Huiozyma naganishii CBS 8797]|uniref:Mitochondrial import inner membrane translocase subunit Tim21 n=1 Tax=Huiozyma naganishii (strain ATCC MYA-139 / BCRC 22969 / CBS 8797 / KCTC 17520 / NBRC 10181 / NCYC 3082 / Yp74L-3) TaxID=1071383 RepID=J7S614_HUIN7|nr:hypothetical protein KNAG_0D03930 [Kazachstania naganishii CBS 8797]CCK70139.1 hypothetical protein KNAG_0D03930 [Kazachstania naganishii CBS 8797]
MLSMCRMWTPRTLIRSRALSRTPLVSHRWYAAAKPPSLWARTKRAGTFTASGVAVVGGTAVTAVVLYLVGSELFSPNGDTQLFNRAVTLVEQDPVARELLQCADTPGHNERLKAYGELITNDRWTRNRPIRSRRQLDNEGRTHVLLRFHLESKRHVALVHVDAVEESSVSKPAFVNVYVDVRGHKRHYVVKPKLNKSARKPTSIFWWTNNR